MKRTNQKEMEAVIASYRSSGLTQRAFCEREGIKLPTFSYWFRRVGQDNPASGSFVEVSPVAASAEELEVVFPNGVIVRGIRDLSVLDRVLGR